MKAKSKVKKGAFSEAVVGNVRVPIYRYRRPGGFYFQIADYSTGTRRLLSFGTLEKAEKTGERIAQQLSSGEVTAASMKNSEAASYGRAVELLSETGDSLELAASRYAEAVKILGNGSKLIDAAKYFVQRDRLPDKTVAQVVSELLAEKKGRREKRTLDDLRNRLTRFAEAFPCPIASVTKRDVQQWLDGLRTSERDKLNYRSKVGTLFRWAWRRDYILSNPVEKTEKPDAENGDVEIYTPAGLQRLIAAAQATRPDYLPCLLLGAFAGLRSSEIERLKWEDVNLARGFITASAKKKGTPSRRLVPIQSNLAAWLAPYANCKGNVWTGTHDQFSDAQQETSAATAVQEDKEKGIAAQEAVSWKHNGLRHSFISYRLAVLQDDAKTALEAGNSKDTVHAHYKELVTPEDAALWFGIVPEKPANVIAVNREVVA
ncbi:MAG: tyrosine-type recombinase/integrase [Verrucomicrobiia bacterium]